LSYSIIVYIVIYCYVAAAPAFSNNLALREAHSYDDCYISASTDAYRNVKQGTMLLKRI